MPSGRNFRSALAWRSCPFPFEVANSGGRVSIWRGERERAHLKLDSSWRHTSTTSQSTPPAKTSQARESQIPQPKIPHSPRALFKADLPLLLPLSPPLLPRFSFSVCSLSLSIDSSRQSFLHSLQGRSRAYHTRSSLIRQHKRPLSSFNKPEVQCWPVSSSLLLPLSHMPSILCKWSFDDF